MDPNQLRPCSACGSIDLIVAESVCFEHVSGSSNHHFDVVVCARCRRTDLFAVDLEVWVRKRGGKVVRVAAR